MNYRIGDYLVFNNYSKFKGVLLVLVDLNLKKVYVPNLKVYGYLLSYEDVRGATHLEVSRGHRL